MTVAQLGFQIDSSGAKRAAVDLDALVSASQRAEQAEQGVGRASREAQGGIRSLATAVKQLTEAESRMGTGFAQKRAQDIAAYGQELDRLRAKFSPIFAVSKQYETSLDELNRAHRVGAIGATEYENALERLNAEFAMVQSGAMRGAAGLHAANAAMGQSSMMGRQLMFQMVDIGQTIPLALQSPIHGLQGLGFQMAQIGQLYFGQGGMKAALRDMAAMAASAGRAVGRMAASVLAMAAANPVVAGLTAIGAAVGVLATGLFDTERATKQANDALDDFRGDLNSAESQIRGLETAALAYSEAIGSTATAQSAATGRIIADTRREFEAKRQLLELEIKRREALQADAQAGIAAAGNRVAAAETSLERLPGIMPPPGLSRERVAATRAAQAERLSGMISEAADEQKRLNAEFTLGDIALGKLREAASMTFEELAAGASNAGAGGAGARAGGGGASAVDDATREAERLREAMASIIATGDEFIAQQELEQQALGMTEEAASRLRIEYDLFNRALQAGIDLTPEQAAGLRQLAGAMAEAEERTRQMTEAQREQQEQQEEMRKQIEFTNETATGFFTDLRDGLIDGASVWDAFKAAGMRALEAIMNKMDELMQKENIFGSWLESILGSLGVMSGGGGGGLTAGGGWSGTTATFGGGVGTIGTLPSAKGNVFHHGNVVPFASGAAFHNGIVSRPTLFPMGLMGEAGPETIMPLRRGPGGRLGVEAHASGVQGPAVVINGGMHFPNVRDRQTAREAGGTIKRRLAEQARRGGGYL